MIHFPASLACQRVNLGNKEPDLRARNNLGEISRAREYWGAVAHHRLLLLSGKLKIRPAVNPQSTLFGGSRRV